jgi:hypothetical protein
LWSSQIFYPLQSFSQNALCAIVEHGVTNFVQATKPVDNVGGMDWRLSQNPTGRWALLGKLFSIIL